MSIYEEIEIEDMTWDEKRLGYTYPCPCGDKFFIGLEELYDGEDVAPCPSCTLRIRVIFEEDDLPEMPDEPPDNIGEVAELTVSEITISEQQQQPKAENNNQQDGAEDHCAKIVEKSINAVDEHTLPITLQ